MTKGEVKPKRVVPGTKLIVLRGGPPEWAEHVTKVRDVPGTLERWDHAADAALVWEPIDETATVEVDRETKAGMVRESKTAQVYRCVGYREDLVEERPEGEDGRAVRTAEVSQAPADGQLEIAVAEPGEESGD